jgi:hypothetical protein
MQSLHCFVIHKPEVAPTSDSGLNDGNAFCPFQGLNLISFCFKFDPVSQAYHISLRVGKTALNEWDWCSMRHHQMTQSATQGEERSLRAVTVVGLTCFPTARMDSYGIVKYTSK